MEEYKELIHSLIIGADSLKRFNEMVLKDNERLREENERLLGKCSSLMKEINRLRNK